jgi:hypothetical protein
VAGRTRGDSGKFQDPVKGETSRPSCNPFFIIEQESRNLVQFCTVGAVVKIHRPDG